MKWKCPICGKEFEHFGIRDFALCPKTTLFGKFKTKDIYGNTTLTDRRSNVLICSEECKIKNEDQYFIEEYKGNKIYCVNGRYMPYLECEYWYDSIEGAKNRIDNPYLIPATPSILSGLYTAMSE